MDAPGEFPQTLLEPGFFLPVVQSGEKGTIAGDGT